MVQNLYKNWLLVSKIIWGIWTTSDKKWKVQNVEIHGLLLSKKYIPTVKTCTEDLSTLLSTTCSTNSLCQFWNHKSFCTTKLLYIFLAQTLHTFHKSSPPKSKYSDFPLLALKYAKFLMSFFKQKVRFSSEFGSFFTVMRDNSPTPFKLKLYMLFTKGAMKVQIFRFSTVSMEINLP